MKLNFNQTEYETIVGLNLIEFDPSIASVGVGWVGIDCTCYSFVLRYLFFFGLVYGPVHNILPFLLLGIGIDVSFSYSFEMELNVCVMSIRICSL